VIRHFAFAACLAVPTLLGAQGTVEQVIDSARVAGLPAGPLHAKVAEGRLKQASDAQILVAVRSLVSRFHDLRREFGGTLDDAGMTSAATALSAGVPMTAIRDMRNASAGSRDPAGELASALVAVTDLVAQRVPTATAVSAVQSLLERRASTEQYARLRAGVVDVIASGRSPEQAVRSTTEAIVKSLPPQPAVTSPVRPPLDGDAPGDARVPSAPTTMRNPR
jgi:hypothetical protein